MEYEKKQRIYKTIMLIVVTVTVTFVATSILLYNSWGGKIGPKYVMLPSGKTGIEADLTRLKTIVDKYYLGEINEEDLKDAALAGYIKGLNDEYSEYIPKKEMEEFSQDTMGNYEGIGIYYSRYKKTNEVVVISTIKYSPADNVGIIPGDIILKVNDEEIPDDEDLISISNKIKGKAGTIVKVTIKRDNEIKDFTIERANVKMHSVYAEVLENNIGYIQFTSFDKDTAKDFETKYEEIKNHGIKSLIIDLRNNGGGIVDEATDIADIILKKNSDILIIKDKSGNEEITKATRDTNIDIPIVVIVNENSASAAEILAGALKDNNVAKIVGTKTYGKGVIQNVFTLTDGSGLKLTTSEYLTPQRNHINHIGIEPDVEVKLSEDSINKFVISHEEDTQLQKAIELLKK